MIKRQSATNQMSSPFPIYPRTKRQNEAQPLEIIAYTDGSAKPNPGVGGYGYVVTVDGSHVSGRGVFIQGRGDVTNNEAEYRALIAALEQAQRIRDAQRQPDDVRVLVRLDSELVVKQVAGDYGTSEPSLIPLRDRVRELMRGDWAMLQHILRHRNQLANDLANVAGADRRQRWPGRWPTLPSISAGMWC